MVVIHWTVDVVTLNSRISAGNSTVITVSVRMPMKASEPTATMEPISLPLIFSSLPGRSVCLPDSCAAIDVVAPFVMRVSVLAFICLFVYSVSCSFSVRRMTRIAFHGEHSRWDLRLYVVELGLPAGVCILVPRTCAGNVSFDSRASV